MTYLFISDLHLSPNHPRLVRGFFDLLEHYRTQQTQLYILGDWFNAWLGDDDTAPWLTEVVAQLQTFTAHGNQVYFLVGNRDFALGQNFLHQFSGQLLSEVAFIQVHGLNIRLEHGDALCTDDVSYQRFRKIIRHPWVLHLLKATPLSFRQKLAQGFRRKSTAAQQQKSYEIMDVNIDAVQHAIQEVDLLIHGHTHRPARHQISPDKERIVLGDWREDTMQAMCLEINDKGLHFFNALALNTAE